jgi:hypothetical protein
VAALLDHDQLEAWEQLQQLLLDDYREDSRTGFVERQQRVLHLVLHFDCC